jgi:hypothetical protein
MWWRRIFGPKLRPRSDNKNMQFAGVFIGVISGYFIFNDVVAKENHNQSSIVVQNNNSSAITIEKKE